MALGARLKRFSPLALPIAPPGPPGRAIFLPVAAKGLPLLALLAPRPHLFRKLG